MPKSERMTKPETREPTQQHGAAQGSGIRILSFGFVSDFGIRISDFGKRLLLSTERLGYDADQVIEQGDITAFGAFDPAGELGDIHDGIKGTEGGYIPLLDH